MELEHVVHHTDRGFFSILKMLWDCIVSEEQIIAEAFSQKAKSNFR